MSEVTVVCCWTNEKQYQDFVNTLKAQTIPYELIGIDNRGNKAFTSCAAAYNSVINQVRTKYVIYSHQDILLLNTECLAKFLSYLKTSGQDDILGSTGVRFDTVGVFTDTKHKIGNELQYAGKNRLSGSIVEVDTLDECFFGGHTKHFRDYTFDEILCDDWHLYAAEACLKTKSKYGHRGGGICLRNRLAPFVCRELQPFTVHRVLQVMQKICCRVSHHQDMLSVFAYRFRAPCPLLLEVLFACAAQKDVKAHRTLRARQIFAR